MTKLATMVICGATFILAFIAFSVGGRGLGFWRWAFEKEKVSRSKNKCMIAFLINDAYRNEMYGDVRDAYVQFKETVDAIDAKGRLRAKVARAEELAK